MGAAVPTVRLQAAGKDGPVTDAAAAAFADAETWLGKALELDPGNEKARELLSSAHDNPKLAGVRDAAAARKPRAVPAKVAAPWPAGAYDASQHGLVRAAGGDFDELMRLYEQLHRSATAPVGGSAGGVASAEEGRRVLVCIVPDVGLGNQLQAVASCLLVALLTDRAMLLHWPPYSKHNWDKLQGSLQIRPGSVDGTPLQWGFTEVLGSVPFGMDALSAAGGKSYTFMESHDQQDPALLAALMCGDLGELFEGSDVVFFTTNQALWPWVETNPRYADEMQALFGGDAFRMLNRWLVQPSAEVKTAAAAFAAEGLGWALRDRALSAEGEEASAGWEVASGVQPVGRAAAAAAEDPFVVAVHLRVGMPDNGADTIYQTPPKGTPEFEALIEGAEAAVATAVAHERARAVEAGGAGSGAGGRPVAVFVAADNKDCKADLLSRLRSTRGQKMLGGGGGGGGGDAQVQVKVEVEGFRKDKAQEVLTRTTRAGMSSAIADAYLLSRADALVRCHSPMQSKYRHAAGGEMVGELKSTFAELAAAWMDPDPASWAAGAGAGGGAQAGPLGARERGPRIYSDMTNCASAIKWRPGVGGVDAWPRAMVNSNRQLHTGMSRVNVQRAFTSGALRGHNQCGAAQKGAKGVDAVLDAMADTRSRWVSPTCGAISSDRFPVQVLRHPDDAELTLLVDPAWAQAAESTSARTAALRSRPRGGKAATTAELKTRQAASAKALERLKGAGGVKVVFKNTLRSTVEMFWMKDEETLLPQGEIAGGQSMEVGSHGGHTFVMKARGEGEGRREWRFAIDGALGAKQTLSNSEKTAKQPLSNSASGRKEL